MANSSIESFEIDDDRPLLKHRKRVKYNKWYINISLFLNTTLLIILVGFLLGAYLKYFPVVKEIIDQYWGQVKDMLNMLPELIQLAKDGIKVVARLNIDLDEAEKILHKFDPHFNPGNH